MAEIRQGYLDDYTQITSGNIGIGTTISNEKFEIIGGTTSQELSVTGIATFSSFSGFIKKHTDYNEDVNMTAGDSGTLSGEIIVGAGLTVTIGTAVTSSQGSIESLKVSTMFQPPSGTTNQRPPAKPGALFYNFDFKTIEFFDGNGWRQVDNATTSSRAVLFRGSDSYMESFNIMTLGNTEFFGTMIESHQIAAGSGSKTRGIIAGGYSAPDSGYSQPRIEYITLASGGDGTTFGELSAGHFRNSGGCSSSTRGLFFGGGHPGYYNTIEYVEISTLGNALDFGDQINSLAWRRCLSSPTRGFSRGGFPGLQSFLDVVTIANKENSTNFGNLTNKTFGMAACSNHVRGIWAGGYQPVTGSSYNNQNVIQYITMASDGNAINFGDLTEGSDSPAGVANQVRAVISGGYVTPTNINRMEYITISTTGNATSFGDLSIGTDGRACGTSDSHGGLGGF